MTRPTKQNWIEGAVWVGIVAAVILGIIVFASLGCSASHIAQPLGAGAMNALMDRLETKIEYLNQQYIPQSEGMTKGGIAAIMAAINGAFGVFYLARHRWFPIKPKSPDLLRRFKKGNE